MHAAWSPHDADVLAVLYHDQVTGFEGAMVRIWNTKLSGAAATLAEFAVIEDLETLKASNVHLSGPGFHLSWSPIDRYLAVAYQDPNGPGGIVRLFNGMHQSLDDMLLPWGILIGYQGYYSLK